MPPGHGAFLKECRAAGCPLDLRLQQKAFQTYLQFAADYSVSHWEDLVAASVREATCHFRHETNTASPEARKAQRRNVVREIMAHDRQCQRAGAGIRQADGQRLHDFYRRKRQVSGEFDAVDAA